MQSRFIQMVAERTGSGALIKINKNCEKIKSRNPDHSSNFRAELIAINDALKYFKAQSIYEEIWILTDSLSSIQHLSNFQDVSDGTRAQKSICNGYHHTLALKGI